MPTQPLIIFDENGVVVPTKSQIFNYLIEKKKEIYGQDIIIQEGTPEYAEVDYMADIFTQMNNALSTLFNSFSPNSAIGVALDNIVALNGIIRIEEIRSTADVLVTGTPGLVILNGVVRDVNNNLWDLPPSITIGGGGTVTVTATAQESGEITALSNTITIIVTQVVGWTSVTNPNPASIGRETESDGQLRTRRTLSTGISAITPIDSLTAAILALDNIAGVVIFENDTNLGITLKDSSDTLPAKTITVVVEGGDQTEIAETIRDKKTLGCGTYGDTEVELTDSIGQIVTYRFERPDNQSIYVSLTITTTDNYALTTDDLIKQALVDEINDSAIATDVTQGQLLNAVYNADPLFDGLRTFNVVSLYLGITASPTGTSPIAVAWNKSAFTDTDYSKIVLTKI